MRNPASPKFLSKGKLGRKPKVSAAMEIRDAFSIRLLRVNESGLSEEAQIEVDICGEKSQVWLRAESVDNRADIFYGTVNIKISP
jgi:hypothetical protein